MLDHSTIYRSRNLLHWHHRARLRSIFSEVAQYRDAETIADVGCSNGYLTQRLTKVCSGKVQGFDYLPELIAAARTAYPEIVFHRADLNREVRWPGEFDLVCCFETLEHVGDLDAALANLHSAVRVGGTLIVSVPVETGPWGILKFCAKTLCGYSLEELHATRGEYLRALLTGGDVTRFRGEAYAFGTHYGFDWQALEQRIGRLFTIEKSRTRYATRIIVARRGSGKPGIRRSET